MTITSARSALQLPYLAVRMPLGLLDEQVIVRVLGSDSSAHRVLAQGLQQLDALAASAFGHGTDLSDERPSGKPASDEPAADGPAVDPYSSEEQVSEIPPEEQQEIAELADAFEADAALAPRAGELAEDDEIRRVQAEIRAKQTVEDQRGQL